MSNKKNTNHKLKYGRIRLIVSLLAVVILCRINVYAAVEVDKADTSVKGYVTSINKSYNDKLVISAQIKPASGGRVVELQRYNSLRDEWVTIRKKTTEDKNIASVSFSIPKKYRKKTTSIWSIYVAPNDTYNSVRSKSITLTTSNIKNINLTADNACIYRINPDGEREFIYSKFMNSRCAQASTTKLMSAVVLMESGVLDSTTKISRHTVTTPWRSGYLEEGDVYNMHDLLYAMMLPSSNDAAVAVAEKVGGSEKKFIKMMNSKAKEMGFKDTHFRNPHGLDADGHYSTAAEVAKLTAYAYSFPEIRKCFKTKKKVIKASNNKIKWQLNSTDKILGYDKSFRGGKTGTTDNAKCCFAGVYKYKGSTYVTVVLRCDYGTARWDDTKKLHEYIRKYADRRY